MPLTHSSPEGTHFHVWAPARKSVSVQSSAETLPLLSCGDGYFSATLPGLVPGSLYRFRLDGHLARPDPCSRFQPQGVHGPSQVIDPGAFPWQCPNWQGVPKDRLVVYEIHVGTFSQAGTYAGALEKLDHILDLGATAIELLPLAQIPGRWNWGYDGVDLYAPNHHYGSPDDLRHFVDSCHQRGLAVILDTVYNHLGPEGNYLADFGPYLSRKHHTPWGPALNFDGPSPGPVRQFIVENALYWLREFRLDGLRLDAIRLMRDRSETHIIHEIAAAVHRFAATRPFPIHLIAETNVHDPELIAPRPDGSAYDLLWNDEIPHALFSAAHGRHRVDTRTYQGAPDLRRALESGYVFHWEAGGDQIVRADQDPEAELGSMLQGLQTHDQIGNHPLGLRLHQTASPEFQQSAAALILLHPAIPMCFMGEEFASPSPFCFFVDFGDAPLRRAVVEGRKRDYAHHDWASFVSPLEEDSFLRSKLSHPDEGHPGMLAWYRALISLRREWLDAALLTQDRLAVHHDATADLFTLAYSGTHHVAANLGPATLALPEDASLLLHSRWPRFGGDLPPDHATTLPPLSAAVYRGANTP